MLAIFGRNAAGAAHNIHRHARPPVRTAHPLPVMADGADQPYAFTIGALPGVFRLLTPGRDLAQPEARFANHVLQRVFGEHG